MKSRQSALASLGGCGRGRVPNEERAVGRMKGGCSRGEGGGGGGGEVRGEEVQADKVEMEGDEPKF